jgi:hypothetical protein
MNVDAKAKAILESNAKLFKLPEDFDTIVSDLKVLGRREYQNLLRIHHKYQNLVRNENQAKAKQEKDA